MTNNPRDVSKIDYDDEEINPIVKQAKKTKHEGRAKPIGINLDVVPYDTETIVAAIRASNYKKLAPICHKIETLAPEEQKSVLSKVLRVVSYVMEYSYAGHSTPPQWWGLFLNNPEAFAILKPVLEKNNLYSDSELLKREHSGPLGGVSVLLYAYCSSYSKDNNFSKVLSNIQSVDPEIISKIFLQYVINQYEFVNYGLLSITLAERHFPHLVPEIQKAISNNFDREAMRYLLNYFTGKDAIYQYKFYRPLYHEPQRLINDLQQLIQIKPILIEDLKSFIDKLEANQRSEATVSRLFSDPDKKVLSSIKAVYDKAVKEQKPFIEASELAAILPETSQNETIKSLIAEFKGAPSLEATIKPRNAS